MLNTTWGIAFAIAATVRAMPAPAPPPAPELDRPLVRIVQNLGTDLRALPSFTTLSLLGAGGAGFSLAHRADLSLSDWARREGASSYSRAGSFLGEGWVQGGLALGTWVVGEAANRPGVAHIGSDLIRAQVLNGVLTTTLKAAVDRKRPYGGHHGFPSGHTSASFASAAVLQGHLGWKAAVPAYAGAGFIAWTRVRDRRHFLSDVVFGAALGTAAGLTVTSSHRIRGWQVVPARTNGGFALYFVR